MRRAILIAVTKQTSSSMLNMLSVYDGERLSLPMIGNDHDGRGAPMTNEIPLTIGRAVKWTSALLLLCVLTFSAETSHAGDNQQSGPSQIDQISSSQAIDKSLTAREAYEKWNAESGKPIILDVRTPEEFLFVGHAPMAWNVPLMAQSYVWDSTSRQFPMQLLPDFVSRVKQIAKPDDTLLVMCRSGGRSVQAVSLLEQAGFRNVYNISDGMEGDIVDDPRSVFHGQRMVNGWKNSGLPWTYEAVPARMVLPVSH